MSSLLEVRLPDLFSISHFPVSFHPQHKEAALESDTWMGSYEILGPNTYAYFVRINTSILGALAYPYATFDKLRISCDLINMITVMDDVSDEQDGVAARSTMDVHIRTLLSGQSDGSAIARMSLSFRERILEHFGPNGLRRFLTNYKKYTEVVSGEAERRESGTILPLDEYRIFRRENGAAKPCFDLIEFCLGIDLPDKVFEDPTFKCLHNGALDMLTLTNDIYSFKREQATPGHSYSNYITVVMKEKGLSFQEAFDYAGREFQTLVSRFVADKAALPSFGTSVDIDLKSYIAGLESWISGNLQFYFETPRYFGSDCEEVKNTLIIKLLKQDDVL